MLRMAKKVFTLDMNGRRNRGSKKLDRWGERSIV